MRLDSRHPFLGALPPSPRDLPLFSARMDVFSCDFKEAGSACPLAFPAAKPVARVASLRCPIPSGSGRLSINHTDSWPNKKAANGDHPLNFVSHVGGSLHTRLPSLAAQALLGVITRPVNPQNVDSPIGTGSSRPQAARKVQIRSKNRAAGAAFSSNCFSRETR
jgi:hypothetical protein